MSSVFGAISEESISFGLSLGDSGIASSWKTGKLVTFWSLQPRSINRSGS
ncbi:hypothetical protein AVDCRST_MAG92-5547 [uncultured Coleofasciculus sp.]|uniref:Uncharacterized protein n=1 Tax=uncultured Coleofasciculus sp. TaxID=1267456 RepID=A0A6J4KIP3_9CYAN|nr:hypothetical protein AVDCRST_MAG92-5547 [uncultured Coleofasciculus sp.]